MVLLTFRSLYKVPAKMIRPKDASQFTCADLRWTPIFSDLKEFIMYGSIIISRCVLVVGLL